MCTKSHFISNFGPDHWLKFPNDFKERSFLWRKVVGISLPLGLSNFGMCGGIASTALDIFYSNKLPPTRTTPPTSKDDKILFNWIKKRQAESISASDLWKYFKLMFTGKKADKTQALKSWEEIKQEIEKDHPVLIGLERAKVEKTYKIFQIAQIVKNHQVVVWGFEETEKGDVTLHVYDPSTPLIKDVKIAFNTKAEKLNCICNQNDLNPVYAFFKTSYTPKTPPKEITRIA